MLADIITIGDEILIGQIVDTNSAYLAARLDSLGIKIRKIHSIADNENAISNTLDESILESDIVILTGGLGPTLDDITKRSLKNYFGGEFVTDEVALEYIKKLHKRRAIAFSERNARQAKVPSTCQALRNRVGSAPGMLFRKEGCIIVSLPGVPFEMKSIFDEEFVPIMEKELSLPVRLKKTVLTAGLSESHTADLLEEWEGALPENIALAYLPSVGKLRLRLSISGDNEGVLKEELNVKVKELIELLGEDHVYGFDEDSLEAICGKLLAAASKTLSVAESCTGGTISHMITSVPGSSAYFVGAVTSYANIIKEKLLEVYEYELEEYGAVSKQVVEQMARGVRHVMDTDYSIATSGVAGPDGGTEEKPVGTIWIAVASREKVVSQKFLFGDHRGRNIERTSLTALNMLRNFIRIQEENIQNNV